MHIIRFLRILEVYIPLIIIDISRTVRCSISCSYLGVFVQIVDFLFDIISHLIENLGSFIVTHNSDIS